MKNQILILLMSTALSACQKNKPKTAVTYDVDTAASSINWKGSAKDHFHVGSFKLSGTVSVNPDGSVKNGNFVIPVSSITDADLPEPMKQKLLDDLKSANFFNMAIYPETKFVITSVKPFSGSDTTNVRGANYLLTGDFTMIGQTHSITFPAKISSTADSLKTEAKFNLDRTKWGMSIYNDPSQSLYIFPDIAITLNIKSVKQLN